MTEETQPEASEEEPLSPEAVAELVYGRIAEDERLRGSLTDVGFGPLLDWCANRIVNVALETPDVSPDELSDAFREAMQRLVATAESGDPSALDSLPSLAVDPSCVEDLIAVVGQGADPDVRAESLAACLIEMSP